LRRTIRQIRSLAILYFVQGICYLAYFLWRGVFSRIGFFRAPPGLVFLYEIYLLSVFFASLYFFYMFYSLHSGKRSVKKSDLAISSLSMFLWILPAITSFGNASSYLTNPNIPPEIKAQWFHYLLSGIFFIAVGIMNILSLLYIHNLQPKEKKKSSHQKDADQTKDRSI